MRLHTSTAATNTFLEMQNMLRLKCYGLNYFCTCRTICLTLPNAIMRNVSKLINKQNAFTLAKQETARINVFSFTQTEDPV